MAVYSLYVHSIHIGNCLFCRDRHSIQRFTFVDRFSIFTGDHETVSNHGLEPMLYDPIANMVIPAFGFGRPPALDNLHAHCSRNRSITRTFCQMDAGI